MPEWTPPFAAALFIAAYQRVAKCVAFVSDMPPFGSASMSCFMPYGLSYENHFATLAKDVTSTPTPERTPPLREL